MQNAECRKILARLRSAHCPLRFCTLHSSFCIPLMRILVTGGAGYIGSHTVRLLLETGHDVWVLDNLSTGHRGSVPRERLIVADLRDSARLDHVFVAQRIEAVVHFAASALVGESVRQPATYWQNNVVATLGLLDTMRRHGV